MRGSRLPAHHFCHMGGIRPRGKGTACLQRRREGSNGVYAPNGPERPERPRGLMRWERPHAGTGEVARLSAQAAESLSSHQPLESLPGIPSLGEGSQPGRCEGQPFCSPGSPQAAERESWGQGSPCPFSLRTQKTACLFEVSWRVSLLRARPQPPLPFRAGLSGEARLHFQPVGHSHFQFWRSQDTSLLSFLRP